jgi:hypothetical protein
MALKKAFIADVLATLALAKPDAVLVAAKLTPNWPSRERVRSQAA